MNTQKVLDALASAQEAEDTVLRVLAEEERELREYKTKYVELQRKLIELEQSVRVMRLKLKCIERRDDEREHGKYHLPGSVRI